MLISSLTLHVPRLQQVVQLLRITFCEHHSGVPARGTADAGFAVGGYPFALSSLTMWRVPRKQASMASEFELRTSYGANR